MLVIGYNDLSKRYLVMNSWGKEWGKNGYCYIPYSYLHDTNLTFDRWIIDDFK
jgi:C1A family cysteine protease